MKADPSWYKGPLTKARVASLRKKLALARGMLEALAQARADRSVHVVFTDPEASMPTAVEIRRVLKRTADP